MKRTRFTPKASWKQLERKARLRPRSAKREREMVDRRAFVAEMFASLPMCQARIPGICTGRATDPHEPKTRARFPGIHRDKTASIPVCRACHSYLDEHQDEAHALGLLVHSWEKAS